MSITRWSLLAAATTFAACVPEAPPPAGEHDEWDDKLAEREVDYNAALRIAALRLTGELPTLDELETVAISIDAAAQKTAYEAQIAKYMQSPKYTRQMFLFAQDMLKMGDNAELDSAPAFLAKLIVDNRSYLDALTATTGTCPTYNPTTMTFAAGNCANGVPATVGLLTHPGMMKHFFGNLAFRRVRWVQETFACTKFPAEFATVATDVGGTSPYTGTFPFTSIAGMATGGRVDFRDTSSVICANCHSNMNHIAPLFAHFNEEGQYTSGYSVPVPLPDNPTVAMSDYLPAGEGMAWRFGVPVTDMTTLGAAMIADRDVSNCMISRVWNWAMGKPDLVDAGARVPLTTIETNVEAFIVGGHSVRDAMYRVFTSDDFVRF